MDLFGLELDLLTAAVRDIMNITAETFAASIIEIRAEERDKHPYVDVEEKGSDSFLRREYRRLGSIYILP